jgi:hypothetical protein
MAISPQELQAAKAAYEDAEATLREIERLLEERILGGSGDALTPEEAQELDGARQRWEQAKAAYAAAVAEVESPNPNVTRDTTAKEPPPPPFTKAKGLSYKRGFLSYSGTDIIPTVNIRGNPVVLGDVQAISYSIHRDKFPVRTLGRTYPKGYSRGGRTIAGNIVWTVFDQGVLSDIAEAYGFEGASDDLVTSHLNDQLPPFDMTIAYSSEYSLGGLPVISFMKILGIEIVDEAQGHSVNDMYIENTMSYVARDIEYMVRLSETPVNGRVNIGQALRHRGEFEKSGVQGRRERLSRERNALGRKLKELRDYLVDLSREEEVFHSTNADVRASASRGVVRGRLFDAGSLSREISRVQGEVQRVSSVMNTLTDFINSSSSDLLDSTNIALGVLQPTLSGAIRL